MTERFIAAVVEALLVILFPFFSSEMVFMQLLMNNRCLNLHASKNCSICSIVGYLPGRMIFLCVVAAKREKICGTCMVLRRCDINKLSRYVVPCFLPSTTRNHVHRVFFSLFAADLLTIWGAVSSGLWEQ